ncbi:MAG: NAD-dependent protein deacylase [Smithella sp.]|jgi:NAD-dependent deacetylase|nr:NAD-dependent protein deacylase [Smithella sp.]
MNESIDKAVALIGGAKKVVVFTGAGISTESGIPDFRGPGGLWTRYDQDDFTISNFLHSDATRKKLWQGMRDGGLMDDASPNAAHLALVELEKMGKLISLVTQNVDNLHQKAGNSPELIRELHGNMQMLICLHCGRRYPVTIVREKFADSESVPACEVCMGILKPDVVFFGEALPQDVLSRAMMEANQCEIMLVIGSSLVVYPAAYVPVQAKQAGAKMIIVNRGPTEQDHLADIRIDAAAGEVMTSIIEKIKAAGS